jgi:HTH-type transcriptional regulator/antitoxin HipB
MRLRTPRDVGAIIRERRRALGLDQSELAKKVGVSRLWINQMERGKSGASLNLVMRTFAAIGIELTADTGEHTRENTEAIFAPDINAIVQAARSRIKNER